jgi:hypothetical protein
MYILRDFATINVTKSVAGRMYGVTWNTDDTATKKKKKKEKVTAYTDKKKN